MRAHTPEKGLCLEGNIRYCYNRTTTTCWPASCRAPDKIARGGPTSQLYRMMYRRSATIVDVVVDTLLLLLLLCFVRTTAAAEHYTDEWAVQVDGGDDVAKELARKHGFEYVAKVSRSQRDSVLLFDLLNSVSDSSFFSSIF